jgi:hypothetical protein
MLRADRNKRNKKLKDNHFDFGGQIKTQKHQSLGGKQKEKWEKMSKWRKAFKQEHGHYYSVPY